MMLCYPTMSSWVYLEYGNLMLNLVLIPSPDRPISFSVYVDSMLPTLTDASELFVTPAVSSTHSLVLLAVHDTLKICLRHFI